jgi:hypothetical protein
VAKSRNSQPTTELVVTGFMDNYLAGTLKEVQYIGTLSNDAKVITGQNMTGK